MNTRPVFFRVSRNRRKAASAPSMRAKALSGSIAKYSRGLVLSALALIGVSQAPGTIYYWDNNGGTANDWASATNWSTVVGGGGAGGTPGGSDVATFSATPIQGVAQTVNLNADRSVLGLEFLSGVTTATTLQGGGTNRTLTIGASGITNASTGAVTIGSSTGGQNVAITVGSSQSWTNNSNIAGEFRMRGLVSAANTLTLAGTGTSVTYLSGGLTLSGTGGLVISKSGSNGNGNNGTQIFQSDIDLGGSGGITINSGAATVVLGTNPGNTAKVTANQNWVNNSDNALYIGGVLAINSQLSLTAGTVTFGDYVNTGTGGVVINGGTAEAGNNATFGTGTLTLTSGTVSSDTINARSFSNAVTVNGNVTIGNATKNGALTFTNTINLGAATRQFTTASNATFSNTVSGASAGLTKAGTGRLTLSGTNTYGGTTTVNDGTLLFTVPGSLYNSTSGSWTAAKITVASGATLALGVGGAGQFTSANVDTIKAIGTASTGFTNGSFLGLDTTVADFSYGSAIGNVGANSVGLKKLGPNTLTLSGTNTYTGTTAVNAGTLLFTVPSALYNNTTASWTAANITVLSGTTLALRVGGAGFTSGNVDTIKAIGTASTGFTNGSFLGLDTTTGDFSYSTAIGNTNGGENSVGLVKLGTNILTLSNANTFTGTTTISAGILSLTNSLALQNSALNTTSSITGDATNGLRTTVTTLTLGGLTGNKNFAASGGVFTSTTGGYGSVTALTLNPGTAVTNSYSGVIANGAAGMTLTKTGLGTQILTGANTYTGTTAINAGTLTVNTQTGSLSASSAISMGGGTFNLDNVGASTALTRSYGSLTFSSGDGTVNITRMAAQNQAITFSSLGTQGAGATGNFVNTGGTNGTANGFILTGVTANAAMGPGYFFNGGTTGANYAYYNAATSFVRGINWGPSPDANTSTQAGGAITGIAYAQSTGSTAATIASGQAFTGLNFQNTTGTNQAVTLAGTITTNGILRSGNGASTTTISGGTSIKTTTAGANLVIRTDMPNDALTISTPILDNSTSGVTKSGAGTLVLSGTASDYTGQTYVNAGTLNIQNSSALGGSSVATVASGGKLQLQGGGVTVGSSTTLTISQPTMSTFAGSITNGTASTGTATSNGVYTVLTFTSIASSGTNATLNVTSGGAVDYLVVGGGGGGGSGGGGGGGAGGVVVGNQTFGASNYIVSVGAGGAGALTPGVTTLGLKGGNSVLGTLTALGGGGVRRSAIFRSDGDDGGSGGGMWSSVDSTYTAGTGLQPSSASGGFGNNGGTAPTAPGVLGGGGGGGAGSVGGNATSTLSVVPATLGQALSTTGGNGGSGFTTSITGVLASYAGGGGGGGTNAGTATAGGGNGGAGTSTGSDAAANTGGGGGGGGNSSNLAGGNGGSGIVVIRYVGAALENVSGNNEWNGAITLGSSIGISSLAGTLTLGGAIGDSSSGYGITKLGDGTVALTVANTYTGATTVSAGTLTLSNSLALQNSPLDTTNSIAGDATNGLKTTVTTLTLGGLTGNKNLASVFTTALGGSGGTTALGGYSDVTALTLNPGTGTTHSYTGIIADGASGMTLTKSGAGTQILGGANANTYTGLTTVTLGTLALDKTAGVNAIAGPASAVKNAPANILVNGGTLLWNAANQIGNNTRLDISSGLVDFNGKAETLWDLRVTGGTVKYSGPITITDPVWAGGVNEITDSSIFGELNVSAGTNTIFEGASLTVGPSATNLTFSGTGTTPNITVNSSTGTPGVLKLAGDVTVDSTVTSASITSGLLLNNLGRLDLNGGTRNFTVNNGGAGLAVSAQVIGSIGGEGLTKSGIGKLTLAAVNNSYTGTTTVSAGTLEVTGSLSGTTAVTVNTGGTLLLNSSTGANNTVGSATLLPNSGSNTTTGSTSGARAYTGASTGTASTLAVGGGTLGSSGNGTTNTFGAMTLTGDNVIDFSSGTAGNTNVNLFFTSLTSTSGFTLQVKGYNGPDFASQLGLGNLAADNTNFGNGTNRLIFTTDPGFGLGSFISGINFDGFGAGATQVKFGSNFEIVPVPEPATTALIGSIALGALIGYRERRRFTGFGKRTAARK